MSLLTTLMEQLRNLWNTWTNSQRALISVAATVCLVTVGGTMFWAMQPDYVVLASQLTPQRAAEIVGTLETEKITAELNFSGSAVSVARGDLGRARLALKDVWEPDFDASETGSTAFPGSPNEEADRRQRKLEARIARSIALIRGVRSATVHISQPDPSPFAMEKVPPTASIIVDASGPGSLTPAVAQSVVSLVSRAVEGLLPANVSLMDTDGRPFLFSDGAMSSIGMHFEHQKRIEIDLATKAESMLALMLGEGKAVVRVTADVDFRESTRTEQTYDPDVKVKKNETIETVSQKTPSGLAVGDTGFSSNGAPGLPGPSGNGDYKSERNTTEFEVSSTNETIHDLPGKITRLTVAAIVDLVPPDNADGTPGTPATDQAQIENIIKQAVGFDPSRNDELQVVVASLETPLLIEPEGLLTTWQQYEPMIQTGILGLFAVGALVMGLLVLKRMKPVVIASSADDELPFSEFQRLSELSQQAKNNPAVAASILASWLEASEDGENETEERSGRAAA